MKIKINSISAYVDDAENEYLGEIFLAEDEKYYFEPCRAHHYTKLQLLDIVDELDRFEK